MTRAEAAKIITVILDCCKGKEPEGYGEREIIPLEKSFKALNMAIEALQQEPTAEYSSDVISRQAVLNLAKEGKLLSGNIYKKASDYINELPSADRPTGHWIDTQVDSAGLAHRRVCSNCGEEPAAWSSVNKFDFCPNCGARMESEEE